jgi:hypothetical protein
LYLANLDEGQGIDLVHLTAANSAKRLADDSRRAQHILASASKDALSTSWAEALNIVEHGAQGESETLESIVTFISSGHVAKELTSAKDEIRRQKAYYVDALHSSAAERGAKTDKPSLDMKRDARIAIRLTRGPLDFGLPASKLKGKDSLYYSSPEFTLNGDERFELVNFIDGRRTVSDIRDALSAEFTPIQTGIVAHYLEDLVKVGVVKWKQ